MARSPDAGTWDFVVVSNRLPVDQRQSAGGTPEWTTSPGGLIAALSPVMAGREAAWVGWPGSTSATMRPFESGQTSFHPVMLSETQVAEHYEGFSNSTIWPLYHDVIAPPQFHREWWRTHRAVNELFARQAAQVAARGATVWVHDYQLQLVPQMLRDLRPDLTIGYFHHIPFPGYELFAQLPWRAEILAGLLGADVIGFQRTSDAHNMLAAVSQNFSHPVSKRGVQVPSESAGPGSYRSVTVAAYPISLDFVSIDQMASRPEIADRSKTIREELGSPKTIFLGIDRLDYTKGIGHRLQAFGELLAEGKLSAEDAVFVQLASPSREGVDSYQQLRLDIEAQVGRINGEFGHLDRPAIVYLHQNMAREEMMALYRAADVMVVSPLRDGMNLVAKEFIAARGDEVGVLLLSEFTGAADELTEAVLINPHDIEGVKKAMLQAIAMPRTEQATRMAALRQRVRRHDVRHWAKGFLRALGATETRS